jgi:hypothetical protein
VSEGVSECRFRGWKLRGWKWDEKECEKESEEGRKGEE